MRKYPITPKTPSTRRMSGLLYSMGSADIMSAPFSDTRFFLADAAAPTIENTLVIVKAGMPPIAAAKTLH